VTFRRTLDTSLFLSVPTIVREVGKPVGDLVFDIAEAWDDFGYGQSDGISLFDLVEVYAKNDANPGGLLVYRGHVEEINGVFDASNNHATIRLFPIDALFGRPLWKASGSYVVTYTSADVDTIFSDAIDDINTIYGATFFTKNLANPVLSINVVFTRETHLAALQQAAAFLPSTWYWRVRPSGQVDVQQFNDSAQDHTLVVGKHVDTIRVVKSALNMKNKLVVSWGPTPTDSEYTDATSQTAYGRRMSLVTDPGITDQPSSDVKGSAELARLKDPATKTVLVVNSQYAIETILPGDTVRVVNISENTGQMISGVLRVLRTEYNGSLCTLNLAEVVDNFGLEISKTIAG